MRKSKDQETKQRELFVENVRIEMLRHGLDKRALSERMGISYQTMLDRFKRPENFSLGEIQTMARYFNVSITSLLCAKIPVYEQSNKE